MLDAKSMAIAIKQQLQLKTASLTLGRQGAIRKFAIEQVKRDFPDGFVHPHHLQNWIDYFRDIIDGEFDLAAYASTMATASHQTEYYRVQAEKQFNDQDITFCHSELKRVWALTSEERLKESRRFDELAESCINYTTNTMDDKWHIYKHLATYCK